MNALVGFLGALVAVLCFGTYAVPVKSFPTGDGMFFQWVQCCSILIVGLIVEIIVGSPYRFEPLGMLGGMFWCLGNALVVPIVDSIGMSLGLLIWGTANMLTGWCAGHFGIFVDKEDVAHPELNYVGITLAALSVFVYFPIKPASQKKLIQNSGSEESEPLVVDSAPSDFVDDTSINSSRAGGLLATLRAAKKAVAIFLAVVAGFLYGINMLPVSHLQQKHSDASPLAYALSHFAGIFATSTAMMVIYCIYKKNRPQIYPQSILPAMIAGTLWAVAQSGWFVGNANLGLTVAFPIICTGPGIVGSLWGVFLFKEIQGVRNFAWLIAAFTTTLLGIGLITLSHIDF